MHKPHSFAILIFYWGFVSSNGSIILSVGLQQKSNMFSNKAILNRLIDRGHTVYSILGSEFGKTGNIVEKLSTDGHKILWFNQNPNRLHGGKATEYVTEFLDTDSPSLLEMKTSLTKLGEMVDNDCKDMLTDEQFMQKLRSKQFDLVVVNVMQFTPCNLLIPHNLSVPFVVISPFPVPWIAGLPQLPSFTPTILLPYSNKMTFLQRLINLIAFMFVYEPPLPSRRTDGMLSSYAPGISGWNELISRGLLFISTRDHILEGPQPAMSNIILLPGISFSKALPISLDLSKFVDNAAHGVIIVSFGSMGSLLPNRHTVKLLEVFKHIPETIIFAHAEIKGLDIPPNVHLVPWIPQNDLLGHSKSKLFISHAGLNGIMESIYHGVPIITVPLFADQTHNAVQVDSLGIGIRLDLYSLSSNGLADAISKILNDDSYSKKVKLLSAIMKDAPQHPTEYAAEKIEHVLRFGGEHLKSHAANMPLYQFLMLDILLFFFVIFVMFVIFVWYMLRACIKFTCKTRDKIKSKEA